MGFLRLGGGVVSDLMIDIFNIAMDLDEHIANANLAAFPTQRKWDDQDLQEYHKAMRRLTELSADLKALCRHGKRIPR